MNVEVALIVAAVAILSFVVAAQNWRSAFLLIVVVGFLQDPIRKLTPGEPVEIVMLSSVVVVMTMLVAMSRVGLVNLHPLTQGNRTARLILGAFVVLVLIQAMMSLVRFKSITIPAIGVISYLAPIPAIWLTYHYARGNRNIISFLKVYVAIAAMVAVTMIMDKLGYSPRIFEEVGAGLLIYDIRVGLMQTYTGIMRTPEVAAWHLGTAACFVVILAASMRRPFWRWISAPTVLTLLLLAALTGRRKVWILFAAFLVIYFLLLVYYRQRSARRALFASIIGGVTLIGGASLITPEDSAVDPYVGRSATVFADASERLQNLGFGSVVWGVQAAGPWGLGAGAVGQGTHHFGGAQGSARYAGEGGLGKIVVELGVLGLVLAVLTALLIIRGARRAVSETVEADPQSARLTIGMLAFCAGNVPLFIGASPMYGDPFALFILGCSLGFVMAGPRVIRLSGRVAVPSISPANGQADRRLQLQARGWSR